MAILEIVNGSDAGRRCEITNGGLSIGRDASCDVVVPEETVSRQHARVVQKPDGFYVEDLRSLNGTYVNGRLIQAPVRLKDRDRIEVDRFVLRFVGDEGGLATDVPAQETLSAPPPGELERSSSAVIRSLDVRGRQEDFLESNSAVKLRAVLEMTHTLGKSPEVQQVLGEIMAGVFRVFPQAEHGYILLPEGASSRLVPAVIHQRSGSSTGATLRYIAKALSTQVMAEGKALLSTEAGDDIVGLHDSVIEDQVRSILCAPLMGPSHQPLGVIHVETWDVDRQFSTDDLEVLVSVALLAGQAVENARYAEAQRKLERQEHELATAREVQLHLLHQERPQIAGYEFFDHYQAAEGVGGDYYGYISMPDGRWGIAVGDVAGKGVSAALMVARLCADVRYCLATTSTPADAIRQVNQQISQVLVSGRFITLALCVLDVRAHKLTLVNAGHLPPFLRRVNGRVEQLGGAGNSGPPLGVTPQWEFGQVEYTLEEGDVLLLCTDGISEARGPAHELYGFDRITEVLSQATGGAHQIGQSLLGEVNRFAHTRGLTDDVCLVCCSRHTP